MSQALASPNSRRPRRQLNRLPSAAPAVERQPVPHTAGSRLKWPLIILAAGIAAWIIAQFFTGPDVPPVKPPPAIKVVTIQATPPPPPLPPPPPPKVVQEEPKMVEQEPVNEEEAKPDEPKPADDAPPDLGTGIKGDGPPDGFGLSGTRGNGGGGQGLSGSGAARSRWGWYAARVQSSIGDALRRDPRLRDAVLNGKVRIWPDASGRITRAKLETSTGDTTLDAAITRALSGVQLSEAPPAGMPTPILLRISARRP